MIFLYYSGLLGYADMFVVGNVLGLPIILGGPNLGLSMKKENLSKVSLIP